MPLFSLSHHRLTLAGLAAACAVLFFWRLADRDLWSSHEARAGMDAQTMLAEGSWGLPRLFDGRAELQKPPLYYWLVAAIARLRGGAVDAWAVRLPAALSALGCVLALTLGMGIGRRRPTAGLLAAAVLATAVHFTWLARIGRIDMPLTLAVTVAVGSFALARRRERAWPLLLAGYIAVALGVLLKGPIGAVLPAAVVGAHLVAEGDLRPTRWRKLGIIATRMGVWWGVPLVLLLTAPWFVWADDATGGEFGRVFFWHHNFGRGLGGTGLRENPWWFYLPQLFVDFFPGSALLVPAAIWCWRHPILRRDPDARLGLTWLAAVLVVLSCARFKRADYLLPAYPGAALFLGCVLRSWLRRPRVWTAWLVPAAVALVVLGWVVRLGWMLPAQEPGRDYRSFAAHIRRLAPCPQPVAFFRTEAHALAFHLGRPLDVFVQWERLRDLVAGPGTHYVVMPPDAARECPQFLPGVRLEEVLRNTELSGGSHERPLVLVRAGPRG